MTVTKQPAGDLTEGREARARRGAAVALACGAVLAAVALAMHLRGGVDDVEFVRRVEEAPEQWLVGHVLMAVGGILLAFGLVAVPSLVRGRGRRLARVASGVAAVGAVSTALGDFAHGALAYVLIGHVSAEQSLAIQDEFFTQPLLAAATMPGLLLPLGMLLLGGALLYSRAVPTATAVLVMVAPVSVQLGYGITSLPMPLMVLPLVAGLGWLAWIVANERRQD